MALLKEWTERGRMTQITYRLSVSTQTENLAQSSHHFLNQYKLEEQKQGTLSLI